MTANLDRLSGGRLVLGVGVGWARQEFAALGVPFEQRGARTDDYLAALRTQWTDEVAEHHGPFVDFAGVHTAPRPASPPPVWVGGHGEPALRRAARFGDAWHPLGLTVAQTRARLPRLAELAREAGRPTPALAPRITIRSTDVDATLRELAELRELGAEAVVLDPYEGDPSATARPQTAWAALAVIAGEFANRAPDGPPTG